MGRADLKHLGQRDATNRPPTLNAQLIDDHCLGTASDLKSQNRLFLLTSAEAAGDPPVPSVIQQSGSQSQEFSVNHAPYKGLFTVSPLDRPPGNKRRAARA
ncbi:MAG: hypothetical protein ACYC3I_06560 [Gemmataceae bacterium]